jgi:hypothetical protein
MKKAIFYTIKKDWRRFSILTVTSENRAGRFVARYGSSRVYGRDERGWPTNATTRDCYGRFETEEAAQEAKTRLAWIFAKHQEPIERAKAALESAQKAESDEIDAMLAEFRQL